MPTIDVSLPFSEQSVTARAFNEFMVRVWEHGPGDALYDVWEDANKVARAVGAVRVGISADGDERVVTWRFRNGDEVDIGQRPDGGGIGSSIRRLRLSESGAGDK